MHGFTKEAMIGAHIKLLEMDGERGKAAERLRKVLDGEALVYETVHNKKDGSPIYFEISSKAITIENELFVQSFYRDITEKKQMYDHLLQSQKMESIGTLTGGIAHDFNNTLTAIMGHAAIVKRVLGKDLERLNEQGLRSLQIITEASDKSKKMIQKLMDFARKSSFELLPINLNDVVNDTYKLMEKSVVGHEVKIEITMDSQLPAIQGDFSQLEHVLMNIINNARDAMDGLGQITISTAFKMISRGTADVPPYVTPGDYVVLSISDTGPGIPERLLSKIFEPFFTTKEKGKGTGLGLSIVYGIIKEHKGHIAVQSKLGIGTAFTIYLPVYSPVIDDQVKTAPTVEGAGQTLLVIDDDRALLEYIDDALNAYGYKVVAACDPSIALNLVRKYKQNISLVIADIAMPHVDGYELTNEIKMINPKTPILAMSGQSKSTVVREKISHIDGIIQKPFEGYELYLAIKKILDKDKSEAISA